MSHQAVSPLRRQMIEDMTIRQFGKHTKREGGFTELTVALAEEHGKR